MPLDCLQATNRPLSSAGPGPLIPQCAPANRRVSPDQSPRHLASLSRNRDTSRQRPACINVDLDPQGYGQDRRQHALYR
jgi:hypothetical protein